MTEQRKMFVDVVFDGPPSHESGRFVEVEDDNGESVNAGGWIDRGDGLWALRIEICAQPAPQRVAVPEGWQLVPKVATRNMIESAKKVWPESFHIERQWGAMLFAAPQPDGVGDVVESNGEAIHSILRKHGLTNSQASAAADDLRALLAKGV